MWFGGICVLCMTEANGDALSNTTPVMASGHCDIIRTMGHAAFTRRLQSNSCTEYLGRRHKPEGL